MDIQTFIITGITGSILVILRVPFNELSAKKLSNFFLSFFYFFCSFCSFCLFVHFVSFISFIYLFILFLLFLLFICSFCLFVYLLIHLFVCLFFQIISHPIIIIHKETFEIEFCSQCSPFDRPCKQSKAIINSSSFARRLWK